MQLMNFLLEKTVMCNQIKLRTKALMLVLAFCVSGIATAGKILVGDESGQLGYVDTVTGSVSSVGSVSGVSDPLSGDRLTDIAFDKQGGLWGLSFDKLYSINRSTLQATLVGPSNGFGTYLNALVFADDGTAYAMGPNDTRLYRINTSTGILNEVGDTGYTSAGDLSFLGDDLYFASSSDSLVKVDINTGASTMIGAIGYEDVWGLGEKEGELWGLAGTKLFPIDVTTGAHGSAFNYANQGLEAAWGAATIPTPIPPAIILFASAIAGIALVGRRKA